MLPWSRVVPAAGLCCSTVPLVAGVDESVTTLALNPAPSISFVASVAPVALAMGIPLEVLGLLIAVETIPDLFRTVGNVTMDTAVTISVAARSDHGGGAEEIPHEVSHARP